MTENEKRTVRDMIEDARENGFRELADTMDMMLDSEDPYEVPALEQPAGPKVGLPFRTGMILGREIVGYRSKPNGREEFVESLRERDKRHIADAFEYCFNRKDEVLSDDFDHTALPLGNTESYCFAVGLSFSIALERARNS